MLCASTRIDVINYVYMPIYTFLVIPSSCAKFSGRERGREARHATFRSIYLFPHLLSLSSEKTELSEWRKTFTLSEREKTIRVKISLLRFTMQRVIEMSTVPLI